MLFPIVKIVFPPSVRTGEYNLFTEELPMFTGILSFSEEDSSKERLFINPLTTGLKDHLETSFDKRETDLFSETNHLLRDSSTGA